MGKKTRLIEQLCTEPTASYSMRIFTSARFKLRLIHIPGRIQCGYLTWPVELPTSSRAEHHQHVKCTDLHDSAFQPAPNYRACIPFVLLRVLLRAELSKATPARSGERCLVTFTAASRGALGVVFETQVCACATYVPLALLKITIGTKNT